MRSTLTLVLCLVVSEPPIIGLAQPATRQPTSARFDLTWGDLAPVIVGQRVDVYPAGVTGTVVAIFDEALVVRASRSSARPRRNLAIPRASVELIRLERNRMPWHLGGVLVGVVGALVGTVVVRTGLRRAPWPIQVWLGVISAYPAMLWTGLLVTRLDTRVTLIRIVS